MVVTFHSQQYPLHLSKLNNVQDFVVFIYLGNCLIWTLFKKCLCSASRNVRTTFIQKPQLKIVNFEIRKRRSH